jgi:hypothetical protein
VSLYPAVLLPGIPLEQNASSRHFLLAMNVINDPGEARVARSSGRTRRALTAIIGISVIGMLGLIALVWLSDFPGATQGTSDKSEAPPEDVRRSQ